MENVIRLATDQSVEPLSFEAAKKSANAAYDKAREAQRDLMADSVLIRLLWRRTMITRARLKSELREAQQQAERAQAVASHLAHALEIVETTASMRRP